MKKYTILMAVLLALAVSGCVGFDFPPLLFSKKPFTLLRGSEQIGRDQITNRYLVGKKVFPLAGVFSNEVITILGQPQNIRVIEPGVSEDWTYTFFKAHAGERIDGDQGQFIVRLYEDKVLDVLTTAQAS